MHRTIRQHFVPQFYLRRFASTGIGENPSRIYTLVKDSAKVFNLPIRSVASRTTFYDFSQQDEIQAVENYFSRNIEGDFSSLLEEIVRNLQLNEVLNSGHKWRLSRHMALQYLRTDDFRESLKYNLNSVADIAEKHLKSYGITDNRTIEDIRFVDGRKHLNLGMNDQNISVIAHILSRHAWRLSRALGNVKFLTSDTPIMLFGQPSLPWMGVGFATYDAQVLFPMDPEFLIHTTDINSFQEKGHLGENHVIGVPDEHVEMYNFMIATYASKQVFSKNREDLEKAEQRMFDEAQKVGGSYPSSR